MSMIKLSEILFEKNKYEKETGENLPNWQEKLKEYEASKDFFVHFSNVPRANLYIKNKFDTPIGFYSYPLDFPKMVDFTVSRRYAIVFKPNPSAKILNLKSYDQGQYISDLVKLYKNYKITYEEMKKWESEAQTQSPAGFIWSVTKNLSFEGRPNTVTEAYHMPDANAEPKIKKLLPPAEQQYRGGGQTGKWTMILNKTLGYDGVIDDCLRIIHQNEACQAVFFNTNVIDIKDIIQITETVTYKDELSTIKVNYSNKNMSGQDLTGKDLSKAILFKTNLSGAKLKDTTLTGATLTGANLSSANLSSAILKDAILTGAILTGATLTDAILRGANLSGANLSGAKLNDADLDGAKLTGAILKDANLTGANLNYAKLRDADLTGADISGANLQNATISNTKLQGALYNAETVFPANFDPTDKKMKLSNRPQLSKVFSSIKKLFKEE
jgi:uncharacterized protein YjbI with pentapeptide repeats